MPRDVADGGPNCTNVDGRTMPKKTGYLHKIVLEEVFKLPLLCRVGQIANVQTASLGGAGEDGIGVLVVGLINMGVGQSIGNVISGGIRGLGLHVVGRHFDRLFDGGKVRDK